MEKEFNLSKLIEIVDVKRIVCPKVKEHIVLKRYIKEFFKRIADKCFTIDGFSTKGKARIVVDIEDLKELAGKELMEEKDK